MQATEALQRVGDADLAQRPAMVATRIALLDAVGDAAGALVLAQSALSAAQAPPEAGRGAKGGAAAGDRKAAEAFLYQSLAKLQLKVRAGRSQSLSALSALMPKALPLVSRTCIACLRVVVQLCWKSTA